MEELDISGAKRDKCTYFKNLLTLYLIIIIFTSKSVYYKVYKVKKIKEIFFERNETFTMLYSFDYIRKDMTSLLALFLWITHWLDFVSSLRKIRVIIFLLHFLESTFIMSIFVYIYNIYTICVKYIYTYVTQYLLQLHIDIYVLTISEIDI